jgi:hypothetical protein
LLIALAPKPLSEVRRSRPFLLRDVVDADTGTLLTDHLWFTTGKWSAGLAAGHIFDFEARAADYIKGYQGRRGVYAAPVSRDWKLQRPTKVTILPRESVAACSPAKAR